MTGELTIKKDGILQTAVKIGTDTAIKPLEKTVFLKSVFVSGLLRRGETVSKLNPGDELQLKREPQPYDELVVAVYNGDTRLGEIADFDEEILARLLDAGKKLTAKVKTAVVNPEYSGLQISVSMIDY